MNNLVQVHDAVVIPKEVIDAAALKADIDRVEAEGPDAKLKRRDYYIYWYLATAVEIDDDGSVVWRPNNARTQLDLYNLFKVEIYLHRYCREGILHEVTVRITDGDSVEEDGLFEYDLYFAGSDWFGNLDSQSQWMVEVGAPLIMDDMNLAIVYTEPADAEAVLA